MILRIITKPSPLEFTFAPRSFEAMLLSKNVNDTVIHIAMKIIDITTQNAV